MVMSVKLSPFLKFSYFYSSTIRGRDVSKLSIKVLPGRPSRTTPQFLVGVRNGFLPRQEPLTELPKDFAKLEQLLQNMPIRKDDGSEGLLATGGLGDAAATIPNAAPLIRDIADTRLLTALFRDYTFLASAILLEPCHLSMISTGKYGLGRSSLPRNIAEPLCLLAEKLGAKPFMEYALSYALMNWKKVDSGAGMTFDNLALIRKFTGMQSEAGFILVHVIMVSHSKSLVVATLQALEAAKAKDHVGMKRALRSFINVMRKINKEMETMWKRSNPNDYKDFRTFIMGIKSQPMFPNGVVYEGVDNGPKAFRGESGANDSIIPTADNLFQLFERMPSNPLTEILADFRTYRPLEHANWVSFVEDQAKQLGMRDFCLSTPNNTILYLANLDQVREFRQRHWNFTKEYILKHSNHPVATGGSPIATWLPNQLSAVLDQMQEISNRVNERNITKSNRDLFRSIQKRMESQSNILAREVEEYEKKVSTGNSSPSYS